MYQRTNGRFSYDAHAVSNRIARIYCDDYAVTTSQAVKKYAEIFGETPKKSTVKRILSDLRNRHRELEAFLYDNEELGYSLRAKNPTLSERGIVYAMAFVIAVTTVYLLLQ